MMANRLPCAGTLYSWLSMLLAAAVGDALYKWHRIPAEVQLTEEQQEYIVDVLMAWIEREYNRNA